MNTIKRTLLAAAFMQLIAIGAAFAEDTNTDKTGLAIQGYDPVAYFTDGKAVAGNFQITAEHDGATYRFATEAHRDQFKKAPQKYLPQYGGYCAYGVSLGKKFPADPNTFKVVEGKLYLNLAPPIAEAFNKDLKKNIVNANMQWKTIATPTAKAVKK